VGGRNQNLITEQPKKGTPVGRGVKTRGGSNNHASEDSLIICSWVGKNQKKRGKTRSDAPGARNRISEEGGGEYQKVVCRCKMRERHSSQKKKKRLPRKAEMEKGASVFAEHLRKQLKGGGPLKKRGEKGYSIGGGL